MDIATLLGILSAFGLLGIAIVGQGDFTIFMNFTSLLIVMGGTLGATLINYPLKDVVDVLTVARKAFVEDKREYMDLIPEIVEYSRKARKSGVLALEHVIPTIDDLFLREGVRMIVDGISPSMTKDIMENEIECQVKRHGVGISIFKSMGQYAPAFGMIGTLIGLIFMLRSLNDVSQIASSMAVALVTTFYGVVLANTVFLPVAGKLKERSQGEILKKEMIVAGVLAIQKGEIPGMVEQRMVGFLPTEFRRIYFEENYKG